MRDQTEHTRDADQWIWSLAIVVGAAMLATATVLAAVAWRL